MPKKRRRPVKKSSTTPKAKPIASKPKQSKPKPLAVSGVKTEVAAATSSEYSYVGREIRHIVFITGCFVAIQIGLWILFNRTGFEDKLVQLIKF